MRHLPLNVLILSQLLQQVHLEVFPTLGRLVDVARHHTVIQSAHPLVVNLAPQERQVVLGALLWTELESSAQDLLKVSFSVAAPLASILTEELGELCIIHEHLLAHGVANRVGVAEVLTDFSV